MSAVLRDFPTKTMFTGVVHDGKIILVEGMHRALALARMAAEQRLLLQVELAFALCEYSEEVPVIGKGDNK